MVAAIGDFENTTPTEEIFLELQDLQALADDTGTAAAHSEPPRAARGDHDPNSIKSRIARLRALLSDRGALSDS